MVVFAAKNAVGTEQDLNLADVTAAGTPSSTALFTIQGNPSGTPVPVTMASSTLPANAATNSAQVTAQANFTSLDSKIPAATAPGTPASTAITAQLAQGGVAVPVSIAATPQTTALGYGSISVGTTAVQLPANANLINGVNLKSKLANTSGGTINVGGNSSVTTTTGFELSPGGATFQAVSNTNQIWAIASAATQILNYTFS